MQEPYRSFIDRLSRQQRRYVTLLGLGGLLETPSMRIRHLLCESIARTYDTKADTFMIGGRAVRITQQEVVHITGLPSSGKQHIPSVLNDHMDLWRKMKDPESDEITFRGFFSLPLVMVSCCFFG